MEPSRDTRLPGAVLDQCPHCRGAVRPGAPWCTQCWADLRPAPEPVVRAPEVPAQAAEPDVVVPSAAVAAARGGWPCSTCGHVNGVELDACAACGSGFLAGLRAAEEPLLVVPGLGDLARYSRAQRLGLSAGVVLAVCVLVLLLGLLLG